MCVCARTGPRRFWRGSKASSLRGTARWMRQLQQRALRVGTKRSNPTTDPHQHRRRLLPRYSAICAVSQSLHAVCRASKTMETVDLETQTQTRAGSSALLLLRYAAAALVFLAWWAAWGLLDWLLEKHAPVAHLFILALSLMCLAVYVHVYVHLPPHGTADHAARVFVDG